MVMVISMRHGLFLLIKNMSRVIRLPNACCINLKKSESSKCLLAEARSSSYYTTCSDGQA